MEKNSVTGTGIAVAIAVIVAIALILFGPRLLTFFNNPANVIATSSSQVQQSNTIQDQSDNTMNSSTSTTNSLAGIPENPTQLLIKDEVVGTGTEAQAGDTVTVNYVGMLTNGTVFDASANHGNSGFTFPLGAGQVIKGWDEGVVGMKVGGKRELIIPASLGYGSQAVGPIPANSTLVFEIELLNVQSPSQ